MNNVGKIATAQRVIAGFLSLILGKKSVVEWGRTASCGENGVIGLPRLKTGSADEIALLTRLAVHEAGHEMHTDFSCINGLDDSVKALMNVLEDPRIEHEQAKAFPGAALILNRGLEESIRAVDSILDVDNPAHSADLVTLNVLVKGYRKLLPHQAMQAGADGLVAKGNQILGAAGTSTVDRAIDRLAECTSTSEVATLAQELWQMLQPPEQQQSESQQEESQAGDDGDDKQSGAGNESKSEEHQPGGPDEAGEDASQPQAEGKPDTGGETGDGPEPDEKGSDESSDTSDAPGGESDTAGNGDGESGGGDPQSNTTTEAGGKPDASGNGMPGGSAGDGGSENASPDAHNQESPEGGNAEVSPDPQKSDDGQNKPGPAGKLDLNSAKGTDLGSLLALAYEHKFGKPDIDAPGVAAATEETTASDDFAQMLAVALEKAANDGESLEGALEAIELASQEASASEQDADSESEPQGPVSGAGGGNASGELIALNATANLNGAVSRLVRIFTKELQDKRRRNVKLAPAGGQVATNRAWRLKAMGDTNVFKVTTCTGGIDAAAMFVLDRSGSMHLCIVDAAKAALACAQALERISRVKTAIEMFPGYEGEPGNTVTLQAFGQSARQVVRRVSDIDAKGGTPLAEALQEAIPKLLGQRVKKRIAFLVTDGRPDNLPMALDEIRKAEAQGVEFVGIGIGEYGVAIEELTPFSICINDASELPDAFEKLFRGNIALKLAA